MVETKKLIKLRSLVKNTQFWFALVYLAYIGQSVMFNAIGLFQSKQDQGSICLEMAVKKGSEKQQEQSDDDLFSNYYFQTLTQLEQVTQINNQSPQLIQIDKKFIIELTRWLLFKNHQRVGLNTSNYGSSFQKQRQNILTFINQHVCKVQTITCLNPSYLVCTAQQRSQLPLQRVLFEPLYGNMAKEMNNLTLDDCIVELSQHSILRFKNIQDFQNLNQFQLQNIKYQLNNFIMPTSCFPSVTCQIQIHDQMNVFLCLEVESPDHTIQLLKRSLQPQYAEFFSVEPISSFKKDRIMLAAALEESITFLDRLEKELIRFPDSNRKHFNSAKQIQDKFPILFRLFKDSDLQNLEYFKPFFLNIKLDHQFGLNSSIVKLHRLCIQAPNLRYSLEQIAKFCGTSPDQYSAAQAQEDCSAAQVQEEYSGAQVQEDFSSKNCPGCTQFYEYGQNIRDGTIHQVPILIADGVKGAEAEQLRQSVSQLCNCYGGIILLFCQRLQHKISVFGRQITDQQKIAIRARIQRIADTINPRPKITVDFVPIKPRFNKRSNIQLTSDEESNQLSEKMYLKGRFVCRIKVYSFTRKQNYLIRTQHLKTLFINQTSAKKIKQLRTSLKKLLKQQKKDEDLIEFIRERQSDFRHEECKLPHKGAPINEYSQLLDNSESPCKLKAIIMSKNQTDSSLKEKMESIGINCDIKSFIFAKNCYLVYTNASFYQLKQKIKNSYCFSVNGEIQGLDQITNRLEIQLAKNALWSNSNLMCAIKILYQQFHFQRFKKKVVNGRQKCQIRALSRKSLGILFGMMFNQKEQVQFVKAHNQLQISQFTKIRPNSNLRNMLTIDFSLITMKKFTSKLAKALKRNYYTSNILRKRLFQQLLLLLQNKQIVVFRQKLICSLQLSSFYTDQIIYGLLESEDEVNYVGKSSLIQLFCVKLSQYFYPRGLPTRITKEKIAFLKILQGLKQSQIGIEQILQHLSRFCQTFNIKTSLWQDVVYFVDDFVEKIYKQFNLMQACTTIEKSENESILYNLFDINEYRNFAQEKPQEINANDRLEANAALKQKAHLKKTLGKQTKTDDKV